MRKMLPIVQAIVFIAVLAGTAWAIPENSPCASGVLELNKAMDSWDGAGFDRAAARLDAALAQVPDSSVCGYWAGVAAFHQLVFRRQEGKERSDDLQERMEAALAAVNRAARLDPSNAENQALLCVLSGMTIEDHPWRAVWWGPRVMKHGRRAKEKGADNPRVQYLLGTCRFFSAKRTQENEEALIYFLRAEELFRAESTAPIDDPLRPRWGRPSALFFMGRTLERLGRGGEATECYRRVLSLQPNHRPAQARLAAMSNLQEKAR